MLEPDEMAEEGGIEVRINIARIKAIGEIERREHGAERPFLQPLDQREMKILRDLRVE